MAGDEDLPSIVTAPRKIVKRKRDDGHITSRRQQIRPHQHPQRLRPPHPSAADPKPISDDEEDVQQKRPAPLKRPGAGARINRERQHAVEEERRKREEDERRNVGRQPQGWQAVAEHYNAVPERGRDWRSTESQIKGLRSLNNWIKSTLIQKFSRPDLPPPHGMCVLDMACGKGGDLGKWEKAPTVPALYVGCDIADVSIDQARQRNAENVRRNTGRHRRGPVMQAEFYVHDSFGQPLGNIPIIRQVGFNPNAGPGPHAIQGGMMSGGFDVVSMMFALHYSFESEALARGMLKNVSGALKKGGKFIGVMPNSDVITANVKKLVTAEQPGQTPATKSKTPETNGVKHDEEDDWDPEKPSEAQDDDDWDPEKPSEPQSETNGATNGPSHDDDDDDDWDPEKPSEPTALTSTLEPSQPNGTPAPASTTPAVNPDAPPLEWGNKIYSVRFPRHQPLTQKPLPRDGIFRPPYGWKYHYSLEEAVNAPEYVVPWEGFRALAEDYGLELLYRKGFREVFEDESEDPELGRLAERMGVMSRDRTEGKGGLMVSEEEMEAAAFYHAFCFYKT
ncbi:mRNA cap guanine-N7 methyltransferase-like [Teratosphaeria destructans]|uniref:mRNA cap guanine-N(7) methyltransferase n=1 Tax=Teratosphaeria destructans TaxID=418781 RepID=A0A9W7SKQ5_9PEZI|nr:mRNA cap guanine-N7 methyltransferase-like [Teratosphaeria destructans]